MKDFVKYAFLRNAGFKYHCLLAVIGVAISFCLLKFGIIEPILFSNTPFILVCIGRVYGLFQYVQQVKINFATYGKPPVVGKHRFIKDEMGDFIGEIVFSISAYGVFQFFV